MVLINGLCEKFQLLLSMFLLDFDVFNIFYVSFNLNNGSHVENRVGEHYYTELLVMFVH